MLSNQPPRPANMLNIVAINQGHRPLTMANPEVGAVSPLEARSLLGSGHGVLDTRPPEAFGAGHVAGALNVQLSSGEFEQRAGWMLPPGRPLILAVEQADAARAAIRKLAFVGLDQRVKGYLEMKDWIAQGMSQAVLPQISVSELRRRREEDPLEVLDVREGSEWGRGHIQGAHHMSFKQLPSRLQEVGLGREDRIAVICGSGMRSSTACSFLLRNGFTNLFNVTGGMTAWSQAGHPVST